MVASQLVSCAPTYNAKLYAASQTFDEARHVEVFNKYLQERIGWNYPVMPGLKALLDKILSDPRWDLKFIGMQIIIEGLALAAFERQRAAVMDPLLKDIFYLVIRDEARHVTFGVNYLEEFVATLSDEESSGISASYTMGGMTIAGVFNAVDSQNGTSGRDRTRKEISVAFAF